MSVSETSEARTHEALPEDPRGLFRLLLVAALASKPAWCRRKETVPEQS